MFTSTSIGPSSAATRATSAGAVARRVGEIGDERERDTAVGGDLRGDLRERPLEVPARARFQAAGHDGDPRALRGEPPRDRRTDAPARSGDHRNLAGQCIAHGGWTIVAWCLLVASSTASVAASRRRARTGRARSRPRPRRDATRRGSASVIAHLLQRHDTATERAEVAAVADAYGTLSDKGRVRFLGILARDFWTDAAEVDRALAARLTATGETSRRGAERALRAVLTPPAAKLFRLFTGLDDGVKFLVDLRADEIRLAADPEISTDDATVLTELGNELRSQLALLFDVGLLELRRLTWATPAALLEKLIEYEAVHTISSWDDLKNRLDSDRRCYAFFHPSMPDEPLVFVEIALTTGTPCLLPPLLDARAPDLAPRPGRHRRLLFDLELPARAPGRQSRHRAHRTGGRAAAPRPAPAAALRDPLPHPRLPLVALADAARGRSPSRTNARCCPRRPERVLDAGVAAPRGTPTNRSSPRSMALCARYLTTTRDGRALDPVANFHLANGASIKRINWDADPSPTGRDRSARPHGQLRVRTRPHRGARRRLRDAQRSGDVELGARAPQREVTAAG